MKKLLSYFCVLTAVFAMTGSQTVLAESVETGTTDYSSTTYTGKVVSIDGTVVRLQLGELSEKDMTRSEGQKTGMGNNEIPSMSSSDEENGQMSQDIKNESERVNDELSSIESGELPPELPTGEKPSEVPDMETGAVTPEKTERQGGGGMTSFTAGEETAEFDISSAAIVVETMDGTTEGSIEDIAVEDVLVAEVGENNEVASVTIKNVPGMEPMDLSGMPGGGFGGSMEVTQGTAANTIDADGSYVDTSYTSAGDDENALRIVDADVTLEGVTIDKKSGETSNTENGDFYGMNAALLATDGANVTINGITVTSSAQNGNGVFSYGEGTVVDISDSVITTTDDNSGGIQTTGGGTTYAANLEITTYGSSSAAIRSDRGGGIVEVDGGSYTSNGYNSPAVYSTAAITVRNAELIANSSEALVIEGKNSMALENCSVYGNMSDTEGSSSDINVHNVMIYQSMSGDAEVGTSAFSMQGGSLTSDNGDMIYVTNTHCILTLSGVDIINNEENGYFLLVSGNDASHGWGNAGANGAQVEFNADGQFMEGDIVVDSISTLTMELTNGSVFTGSLNIIDNEQGGMAVDNNAIISIDSGSIWNLTGDCTVTDLTNEGTINFNGYKITLADGTILTE